MDYFSNLWRLKLNDVGRAFVLAVIAAPMGLIYDWAMTPDFAFTFQALVKGAVAGGAGYLIKNFFTGQNGKLLTNK